MNWMTLTTEKLAGAGMAATVNQEQQRAAIGPGSGHFISVRQVSCDAATMQRDTCGHAAKCRTRRCFWSNQPRPVSTENDRTADFLLATGRIVAGTVMRTQWVGTAHVCSEVLSGTLTRGYKARH